ncbi:MAG: AMP-binding protein [Nostoc sp. ChiSLP02]|nr:AMP-binding protein [Nostoc sp. DedSLP05]MDZ8101957.1 AMP-binding protein [Nostoc sp. DedSLP01]MDZ8185056.1 AMP-binding protein [Nostoc sp. ChiSLP02]
MVQSNLTVDDCVVRERQTQNLKQEIVAYIVPSGLFTPEQLLSDLKTILPSEFIPAALVPVSAIPLTNTGQVDEVALSSLEVIDSDLIHCIEEKLESLPEIERVAVVVEPVVTTIPPVHLEDLLGETQAFASLYSQQNSQTTTAIQKIENKSFSSSKKLAISHGEPLQYSEDAPKNLVEVLQRAAQNSTKGIIYIQPDGAEKAQSYSQLWQDAQRILAGLRNLGLKPQDKVIFQLEDNQDFISAFWGCVLGGFVPVPVSIAPSYEPLNSSASKLQNTWQMLEKPLVLTSTSLAGKIDSFSRLLKLENFQFATVDKLRECQPDLKLHQSQPEDLAILFLTSGSTGIPKCVMLNHHTLGYDKRLSFNGSFLQPRKRFKLDAFGSCRCASFPEYHGYTIPDWFYHQVWQPKSPIAVNSSLIVINSTLIFLDSFDLGTYLCQRLSENNLSYNTVSPGEDFLKINRSHYTITPGKAEHYQLLIEFLATDNIIIGQILHLWNYDQYIGEVKNEDALEQAQERGIYSLLFLVQALAKVQGADNSVQLLFISSHIQPISPDDPIAYEKSAVLGLLKTIPQELPNLNCRHIDLPFAKVERNGTFILQEMQVSSKEREVAYRNGQRFVPCLKKVDFKSEPKSSITFKQRGIYLITGGLGGIGIEIARYLLNNYQARLLLVGRTSLPDKSTWSEQTDILGERLKAYQELEQLEGEVIYEAVDICDFKQLQIIVQKAQSQWGKNLDGVLHLVGTFHEQLVLDEQKDNLAGIQICECKTALELLVFAT